MVALPHCPDFGEEPPVHGFRGQGLEQRAGLGGRQGVVGEEEVQAAVPAGKRPDLGEHAVRALVPVALPLQVEVAESAPVPPAAAGKFHRQMGDEIEATGGQFGEVVAVVGQGQGVEIGDGRRCWCLRRIRDLRLGGEDPGRRDCGVAAQRGDQRLQRPFPLSCDAVVHCWKGFRQGPGQIRGDHRASEHHPQVGPPGLEAGGGQERGGQLAEADRKADEMEVFAQHVLEAGVQVRVDERQQIIKGGPAQVGQFALEQPPGRVPQFGEEQAAVERLAGPGVFADAPVTVRADGGGRSQRGVAADHAQVRELLVEKPLERAELDGRAVERRPGQGKQQHLHGAATGG